MLATLHLDAIAPEAAGVDPHEAVGSAWGAAVSSFCFFASVPWCRYCPTCSELRAGPR